MLIFLLTVIAILLLLIYRHLTKKERQEAKFHKYLAKQEAERNRAFEIKEEAEQKKVEALNESLDSQISKYHKTYKTWNWRK